tara:strand:+ start:18144 stop:18335 length:192 start_codon:yes stop_codon:yes gene_type:complete
VADEIAGTHRKTFEGNPHVAVAVRQKGGGGSEVCHGLAGGEEAEAEDVEEGGELFAEASGISA